MRKLLSIVLVLTACIAYGQNPLFNSVRFIPSTNLQIGTVQNGHQYYDLSSQIFLFRQGGAWVSFVPSNRSLTINGTAYDLSANRSWTVGDVFTTRTLTINGTTFDLSANRSWTVGDVLTSGSYANPSWITQLAWSKIITTPTTLSGYGITDAQPLDSDLTAIAALSADGFLKKTAGVWGMDNSTYLTANQTITLSGDITGSGTTAITTTYAGNLPVSKLNSGSGASSSTFWRGDATWATPVGTFSGSIASGQIAFGTGANAIGGDADLTWNSSTNSMLVTGSVTATGLAATTIDIANASAPASSVLYTKGFTFGIHGEAGFDYDDATNALSVGGSLVLGTNATYTNAGITAATNYTISAAGNSVNIGSTSTTTGNINLANTSGTALRIEPDLSWNVNGSNGASGAVLTSSGASSSPTWTTPVTTAASTYTPTYANIANANAITAYVCQYLQVGSVVTVSGRVTIDPTADATLTTVSITLPVSVTFSASRQCGGAGGASDAFATPKTTNGHIEAVNATSTVYYTFLSNGTDPVDHFFTFTYLSGTP